MSSAELQVTNTYHDEELLSPYLGPTVIELMAEQSLATGLGPGQPPQTPPTPFQTHTRSGEGFAQITDDADQEFLYE